MKLGIVLAVAVLAAAGTAGGVALAQDSGGFVPDRPVEEGLRGNSGRQGVMDASRQIHLACAVDMHKLCAGKAGQAADRCLIYHRMSFSRSCRAAIDGFERVVVPLGPGETIAPFGPYSRYQARSEPPATGWLGHPASATANGA